MYEMFKGERGRQFNSIICLLIADTVMFLPQYIHLTLVLIVNEHFTPNLVGLLCTQVAFKLELSLYLLLIVQ